MNRTPLRYIALLLASVVLIAVSAFTVGKVMINHAYVKNYEKGSYDTSIESYLIYMNFPESYIPYYNLGEAAFQKGDYISAVGYYSDALKNYPPEGKDCLIRINLALSLCYTIDFDNLDSENAVENALVVLYKARDILLENGCADDEGTGHNADAQQLKEDIDRMIEKLEDPDNNKDDNEQTQDDTQSSDEDGNSGSKTQSSKEKQQQEQLQQNKKNALEERKEEQSQLEKYQNYEDQSQGQGSENEGEGGGASGTNHPW